MKVAGLRRKTGLKAIGLLIMLAAATAICGYETYSGLVYGVITTARHVALTSQSGGFNFIFDMILYIAGFVVSGIALFSVICDALGRQPTDR